MHREIDPSQKATLIEAVGSARAPRLKGGDRRKANSDLEREGMDGNSRFASVSQALGKIWGALNKHGLEPGDSAVPFIKGDEGKFTQEVAWKNDSDPFSPTEVSNSVLAVFWTRLDKNKYEVIAYLS